MTGNVSIKAKLQRVGDVGDDSRNPGISAARLMRPRGVNATECFDLATEPLTEAPWFASMTAPRAVLQWLKTVPNQGSRALFIQQIYRARFSAVSKPILVNT